MDKMMLHIEKKGTQKKPFCIIDKNGGILANFADLYDAVICLRFIAGEYMPREKREHAERVLNELKEKKASDSERQTEGGINGDRAQQ